MVAICEKKKVSPLYTKRRAIKIGRFFFKKAGITAKNSVDILGERLTNDLILHIVFDVRGNKYRIKDNLTCDSDPNNIDSHKFFPYFTEC